MIHKEIWKIETDHDKMEKLINQITNGYTIL